MVDSSSTYIQAVKIMNVGVEPDAHTRKFIMEMSRFNWRKTWSPFPRKCRITKQWHRPFSTMYWGTRILNGPCEDILLTRWLSPEAYMFEKLKGNI